MSKLRQNADAVVILIVILDLVRCHLILCTVMKNQIYTGDIRYVHAKINHKPQNYLNRPAFDERAFGFTHSVASLAVSCSCREWGLNRICTCRRVDVV